MSFLAKHAQGKGGPDPIFAYGGRAAARAQEIGKENVINATIGAFLNPDGTLSTMKTVEEAMKAVPFQNQANYAPIYGMPQYIANMIDSVFHEHKPNAFIDGIATPGGTGALRNAFFNYLNEGEVCITTDFFWGNYTAMLSEINRGLETFNTFNADGTFDVDACIAKCKEMSGRQQNILLLLNTPAHNPTGFSVTDDEWKTLLAALSDLAKAQPDNNIIIMIDVAYIDYSGPDGRKFFKQFENLPHNILGVVCASTSKGYTLYGYRLGCEICIAQTEEAMDEFILANGASARSTWSNASRPAMEAVMYIYSDADRLAAFRAEQDDFSAQLAERAKIFMDEAKEVGLKTCPYHSGFFIYLPTETHEEAEKLTTYLSESEVFTVPLGEGVRIAICAIDKAQIVGMAQKCKDAADRL